jgi:preprotein translocase subunit SecD
MKFTLIILLNVLFVGQLTAQENSLSKIKWTEASDTLKTKLKAGYYLCVEVPKGYEAHGFKDIQNKNSYVLSKKDFMELSHIDTVFKSYDRGVKLQVINIKFDNIGAKALLDFTMKWQGQKVGLLLRNKFIYVATIASPISGGTMTLTGDYTTNQLDDIVKAIKTFKR